MKKIFLIFSIVLFTFFSMINKPQAECDVNVIKQVAKIINAEGGYKRIYNESFFVDLLTAAVVINNAYTKDGNTLQERLCNLTKDNYGGYNNYKNSSFEDPSKISASRRGYLMYLAALAVTGQFTLPKNMVGQSDCSCLKGIDQCKDEGAILGNSTCGNGGKLTEWVHFDKAEDVKGLYGSIYFGYSGKDIETKDVYGRTVSTDINYYRRLAATFAVNGNLDSEAKNYKKYESNDICSMVGVKDTTTTKDSKDFCSPTNNTPTTTWTPKITIELQNKELKGGEFIFVLEEDTHEIEQVKNKADGTIPFSTINYRTTDVGEHVYHVYQLTGNDTNIEYSNNNLTIVVNVEYSSDEGFNITQDIINGSLTFINKYKDPGSDDNSNDDNDNNNEQTIEQSDYDFCSKTASIWKVIGFVIFTAKILIPLLLIIFGMIDLGKAVVASKDDQISKSINALIKRIIAGIIVFFIPSLITAIFNLLEIGGFNTDDGRNCIYCMTKPFSEDCDTSKSLGN